jgi:transposase
VKSKRPKEIDEQWSNITPEVQGYIEKLEGVSNRTSKNSSIPPSQSSLSQKVTRTFKSPNKQGAQIGHKGHFRPFITDIPQAQLNTLYYKPEICENCFKPFAENAKQHEGRKHQVTHLQADLEHSDLTKQVIKVTNHRAYKRYCDDCRRWTKSEIPAEILKSRFSVAVTAFIGSVSIDANLSVRGIQRHLLEIYGVKISLGTIINARILTTAALEDTHAEIKDRVAKASVVYQDETSMPCKETVPNALSKRELPTHWLWCSISERATFMVINRFRSQEAQKELPFSKDAFVVSDNYGAYSYLSIERRQLCLAHLIRNFQKFADSHHLETCELASLLQEQLRESIAYKGLGLEKKNDVLYTFQELLEYGINSEKKAFSDFCWRLFKLLPAVFTFIEHQGIEPTNNIAERALRKPVIKRKISLFAQSRAGLDFLAHSWSVALTCQQNGIRYCGFLIDSIQAYLRGQPAPKLFAI